MLQEDSRRGERGGRKENGGGRGGRRIKGGERRKKGGGKRKERIVNWRGWKRRELKSHFKGSCAQIVSESVWGH